MDALELLYVNQPDVLPLQGKRGANWYLDITDTDDSTGAPIDRTGWVGKMRLRLQKDKSPVAIVPAYTLVSGPLGHYRFDITYADMETMPLDVMEYDIFIRLDPDSICIFEGTFVVEDNTTPIP